MLAAELVGKTKKEIKDLLLLNTREYRFNDEFIETSFDLIYGAFVETDSVFLERQAFWQAALEGLFGIEGDIIAQITNELGAFELIAFCENNLGQQKEVQLFREMYATYHEKRESLVSLINTLLSSFIEDLSDIKPEEISKLMDDLNFNLNNLPDFIKNAVK